MKSKKRIKKLFKEGEVLYLPPLRIVFLPCSVLSNHQVLFAVPSKKNKSAVYRNKLRRRMREAYRLNKHFLAASPRIYFLLAYIYVGSGKPCKWETISERLIASLQYLNYIHAQNK